MNVHWADRPFLCLDTETTGVDPFSDRIVQVAAVAVDTDGTTLKTPSAHCIVNPGVPIPDAAAEVHGITTDRAVREGVPTDQALIEVAEAIWRHHDQEDGQGPVVMFNGARADALAAGRVMRRILDQFPALASHTLASLWLHHAHGHEQDRQRFEDYLRRNVDPEAAIVPGWPVPVEGGSS